MNLKTQAKSKGIVLKLISVIMAVLLWLYVVNHGDLTASQDLIKVDLQYRNLAEGMTVSGPDTVSVKLWGSFQEIDNITAYVDLAGKGEGSCELPVKLNQVKGAMFTSVQPDKVTLVIKKIKEKSYAVKYSIAQSPPSGFEVLDVVTIPDKCLVTGEENDLKIINSVVCTINLGEVKDTDSQVVPLAAKDSKGKTISEGIRLVPDKVLVYTVVGEKQNSKKVKVKTEFAGIPEPGYQMGKVDVNVDTVTVLGAKDEVEALNEVSTKAIDLTGKKASFAEEVEIIDPAGLKVYPSRLMVNVEIKKVEEKEVVQ
ncbi:MAG: CdaR family protein [Syntrophomonas sp.]